MPRFDRGIFLLLVKRDARLAMLCVALFERKPFGSAIEKCKHFSAALALLGFYDGILSENDDSGFGDVEELLVAFQVVANLEACRNM